VLDLTLPHVADAELETMIDQRTAALVRQLDAERNQPHQNQHIPGSGAGSSPGPGSGASGGGGGNGSGRGQVVVQFFEKRRRKSTWYAMRAEEEICWESWTVKVTVAEPRTESGKLDTVTHTLSVDQLQGDSSLTDSAGHD
jgi:hypothetical protein